jgi:excisionase family DNA binding protein
LSGTGTDHADKTAENTVSTLQRPKAIYTELEAITGLGDVVRLKQALTTGEVAKYCGVNFRTVIRWIERGHLEAYKLPGRGDNRIPLTGFIAFLQNNQMPVPDELRGQGRTLLILSEQDENGAEIAACARRAGWEPMVTADFMQFGFICAHQQPSAVVVTSAAAQQSVNRIRKEVDNTDMMCILVSPMAASASMQEGWFRVVWPLEQKRFAGILEQPDPEGEIPD